MKSEKSNALEGIRGIAALIVVLWHSLLGFMPSGSGIFEQWPVSDSWRGSPIFIVLNGNASVVLFFVLSGFVLTASSLRTNNTAIIYRNALKRWPRLVAPVLCAVLLSYLLFKLNAFWFEDAAKVSQSPWLYRFAYGYDTPFIPDLWAALRQGLYATFLFGDSSYNSSLWTMRYEFFGSFIILAVAFTTIVTGRLVLPIVLFFIFAPVLTLFGYMPFYMSFFAGCALSSIAAMKVTLKMYTSIPALISGVYLFGYAGTSMGIYSPIPAWLGQGNALILVQTIAAILILGSVILTPSIHTALNKPFMKTLGWLSFPLYLVNAPVVCSIGSWAYLHAPSWGLPPAATGFVTTVLFSLIACIPLAIFNDRWVTWINQCYEWLLAKMRTIARPSVSA